MSQGIVQAEVGPCPFCGSERVSSAPPRFRDARRPSADRAHYVVALEHASSCPRWATLVSSRVVLQEELAVAEDFLRRRLTPGEGAPLSPVLSGPHAWTLTQERIQQIGIVVGPAIQDALAGASLGEVPIELAVTLLVLGCNVAEASDPNTLPAIFLAGFLPHVGVSEAEAVGLVRMAYADHAREAEESVERMRVDLAVEEARLRQEAFVREAS